MPRNLPYGPGSSRLLLALAGVVLLALTGCEGGDPPPAKQLPLGSACESTPQCEKGLCLVPPGESEQRCVQSCSVAGEVCSTGGRCLLFGAATPPQLACSLPPYCTSAEECGANATCVKNAQGLGACQCLDKFHGDPGFGCSVCSPENAREGCTLRTVSLPEVKGRCRSLDGTTVAGECTSVHECPDATRFGCFGFLPAVVADPPCSCADLRKLDVSGATALGNLAGAWYGASTVWPKNFDPSRSGALGPKAQLAGIDLSGTGPTSTEVSVVGGEVLTPDPPFNGTAQPSFTGDNGLRHGHVVSGSFRLMLGAAVLRDAEHGVLAGSVGAGEIDYARGTLWVQTHPAPAPGTPAEAAYRYRVHGLPLRPLSVQGTEVSFEVPGATDAPIVPRSVTVRIVPEPLVADAAPNGSPTELSFTGANTLLLAPIVPGSVRILVGDVELKDNGSGTLSAGPHNTGRLDYGSGELHLSLAQAPVPTAALAAYYQAARTHVLVPDVPFNGSRTRATFSRARALPLRPLVPGSVRLVIGDVAFTDSNGQLQGADGSTGSIDYETGALVVTFKAAPREGTSAIATFASKAALTLSDSVEANVLAEKVRGSVGTLDMKAARVHVKLTARPHPRFTAVIDFERHAEKTLVTTPRLDGSAASVEAVLGPAPLGRGGVRLGLGPEVIRPQPSFNGSARDFTFSGSNALARRPIAPGTLVLEVGGKLLADVSGDGRLLGDDGSKGTIRYASGEIALQLASAPPASAKATASYAWSVPSEGLTPDQLPDGKRRELVFSGTHAVRAPIRPGSVELTVTEEGLVPDGPYDGTATDYGYQLARTPVAPKSVQLSVGGVLVTGDDAGKLTASDGSITGAVEASTGRVSLTFTRPPAIGTLGTARYEVGSADTKKQGLTPDKAFDGKCITDGKCTTASFTGVNALGGPLVPGSLRVVLESVPLVPDVPYGQELGRTAYRYSNTNAFIHLPVVPGSVTVQVGGTKLVEDARTAGVLTGTDGSTGTVDPITGVIALQLASVTPAGTTSTVSYRSRTTGKALTPDRAPDGRRTRFTFTGAKALGPAPLVPGSVTIALGTALLMDVSPGRLMGPEGIEGTIDYDTGEVSVSLGTALPSGALIKGSYLSQSAVVLRDDSTMDPTDPMASTNLIGSHGGSSGTVNLASGQLSVTFPAAPAPGAIVRATFARRATPSPEPAFDGFTRKHRFTLAKVPVVSKSLVLTLGATTLRETADGVLTSTTVGSSGTVDPRSGLVEVTLSTPVPAGTVAIADYRTPSAVVLRELGAPGELRASDGSSGQVDYQTGVIRLALASAPRPGAVVTLKRDAPAEVILSDVKRLLTSDKKGVLTSESGASGTIDYATGKARLALGSAPPASTRLTASFTHAGVQVARTNLEGIEFAEANLAHSDLSYTNLRYSKLARADLTGADLTGADLEGADLRGAKLKGAKLKDARLEDANLIGADINGADLTGATGIDPERLKLPAWYVAGTPIDCAGSVDANCQVGRYSPKELVEAIRARRIDPAGGGLQGAMLAGADLSGLRDLTGAKMAGANLRGANLRGLKLSGVDLSDALLDGAILTGVQAPDTVCPATGAVCYDGGKACRSGPSSCAPNETAVLKLTRATLTEARMDSAILTGTDLRGTVMTRVELSKTDASRAKVVAEGGEGRGPVDLTGANLTKTVFAAAELTGAVMRNVQMDAETRFIGAKMAGVDLEDARLGGVWFTNAGLAGANLQRIRTDEKTRLNGADLTGARLAGADLRGANLDGAKLEKADLTRIVADERTRAEGASFNGADLTEACLTNSTLLRGAKLTQVRAPRASFVGAQLQGTDFTGVDLPEATLASGSADAQDKCHCTPEKGPLVCGFTAVQGAIFKTANLYAANLGYTDMRGVNLEGVDLRTARLERTDLRGAILIKAKLPGNDLRTAILSGANLTEANLAGADLSGNELIKPLLMGADLTRANLRRTVLLNANLSGAVLDQVDNDSTTVMREANLDLTTIRGCFRANLSDATLRNAALLQAGFAAPNGKSYDATNDFNCRMDFEGALLPTSPNTVCGTSAPFPSTGSWLEGGRATNGVYAKDRLLARLTSVKTQLDCAYLPGADLRGRDLGGASLRGARLTEAKIGRNELGVGTNLAGAQLQKALLTSANLEWANLSGARLNNAAMVGTSLEHSDLRGADLSQVRFDGSTSFQLAKYSCPGETNPGCTLFPNYPTAPFRWRQLKMIGPQSDLGGMDLSAYPNLANPPVDLRGANLKDAKFNWTNVSGVSFNGANLESASFSHADVTGANFSNSNLKSSNFSSASISAATNYSGSNIIEANFVASSGTPLVGSSICSEETAFNSARRSYVFLLKISIEGSFPLYFPVITLQFVPGWNVAGQCCFPVQGGIRIGC